MKTTSHFHLDPETVLKEARKSYQSVVVIGIDFDGEMQIASSEPTPHVLAMINQAPKRIEEIREAA